MDEEPRFADREAVPAAPAHPCATQGRGSGAKVLPFRRPGQALARADLWSCSLEVHGSHGATNAFFAIVTPHEAVFRRRVEERFGARAFDIAQVFRGPIWGDAIGDMLISEAVRHMLDLAAADPCDELSRGFEVSLQIGFLK